MKLGIGSYTFMWSIGFPGADQALPMSALDVVERARQLGVEVVQFGPNLPLERLDPPALEEVLTAIREYGLELEVGTRGVLPEHLHRMVEFARSCGSTFLRTLPEVEGGRIPSPAELVAHLAAVEPELRAAGVRLGIENSLVPAAVLASVLELFESSCLGITLDTVNSLAIPEGTREVAVHLAPWTSCLHVKDFVVRRDWHMMGFRVEGRPAGAGQLDIPWLLGLLRAAGVRANAVIETWVPEQPTLAEAASLEQVWAEQSVAYLKEAMAASG